MIIVKINEIEYRKPTENIDETKSWFFEKINKIYKYLGRLNKKRKKERKHSNY